MYETFHNFLRVLDDVEKLNGSRLVASAHFFRATCAAGHDRLQTHSGIHMLLYSIKGPSFLSPAGTYTKKFFETTLVELSSYF